MYPILTVFCSNLVQPWLRLTIKKSNLSQGHYRPVFVASLRRFVYWSWILLLYELMFLDEIIKIADKFILPKIRISSWFFSTSNSSYGDWAHTIFVEKLVFWEKRAAFLFFSKIFWEMTFGFHHSKPKPGWSWRYKKSILSTEVILISKKG